MLEPNPPAGRQACTDVIETRMGSTWSVTGVFCLFPPRLGVSRGTWVCVHVFNRTRVFVCGVGLCLFRKGGRCGFWYSPCDPAVGAGWPAYLPIIPNGHQPNSRMASGFFAGSSLALNLGHRDDTPGGGRPVPEQGQSRREGGQPGASGLGRGLGHALGCELSQHVV